MKETGAGFINPVGSLRDYDLVQAKEQLKQRKLQSKLWLVLPKNGIWQRLKLSLACHYSGKSISGSDNSAGFGG
jgi:hypothetical protein